MPVSLLSPILLACTLAFTSVDTEITVEPITHTLTIKAHEGGKMMIDGVSVRDTVLQLSNAHVATLSEEGNKLYTVIHPDGKTFYKGDFTLAVQSVSSGTLKIKLSDGEAILARIEVE